LLHREDGPAIECADGQKRVLVRRRKIYRKNNIRRIRWKEKKNSEKKEEELCNEKSRETKKMVLNYKIVIIIRS
jgi:hypothetical protein